MPHPIGVIAHAGQITVHKRQHDGGAETRGESIREEHIHRMHIKPGSIGICQVRSFRVPHIDVLRMEETVRNRYIPLVGSYIGDAFGAQTERHMSDRLSALRPKSGRGNEKSEHNRQPTDQISACLRTWKTQHKFRLAVEVLIDSASLKKARGY